MQEQRAEGRQCAPWDHSTSVLLLFLLLLYAYKSLSCCTIVHLKIGSLCDNCTYKFVCTSVFASSVFVFLDTDAHLAEDDLSV